MIAVLGSGSWGTALAVTLAKNTNEKILVWGKDFSVLQEITLQHSNKEYLPGIKLPPNIVGCESLDTVLNQSNDILIAVPSNAFAQVLDLLKPLWTKQHRVVWATKGLEPVHGRFLHQVVEERFGREQVYAILSGPSFAKEVAQSLPTAVDIATTDKNFADDLLKYFHNENFRVYLSKDIIGAQIGGVVKNILAVAAGLSDGLGFGANARAAIITRGIAEMMRLGLALGAQIQTLQGLSGVGDVILTCTDNQSRNRRFGLAIAQGKDFETAYAEIGQAVEATNNAEEICKIAKMHAIDMPIAEQVYKVLSKQVSPQQAAYNLISRKPLYEWK